VAVKNSEPASKADSSSPPAWPVLAFQEKVSESFKKAGGTIIGTDGDMVSACFGSPLERVFLAGKKKVSPYEDNIHALATPALRAVDFISEIARRPECGFWNFGLDLGNCTFFWTAVSGYFALGTPVQRARILSRLAGRYRTRIVISSSVNEALPDLIATKLDILKEKDGPAGEPFYSLAIPE
jgi:class 3 adenylate cyclase